LFHRLDRLGATDGGREPENPCKTDGIGGGAGRTLISFVSLFAARMANGPTAPETKGPRVSSVTELLPLAASNAALMPASLLTLSGGLTLADGPTMLISLWKPIVIFAPFIAWLWVIARVLDKHAARFFLPREMWNVVHLSGGLAAVLLVLLNPMPEILGFVVALLGSVAILASTIIAYVIVTSKDERVPEAHRLNFGKIVMPAALPGAKKAKKSTGAAQSSLTFKGTDKQAVPVPPAETTELEIRVAAEKVLIDAFAARASVVELTPISKDQYGVKQTVDGVDQGAQTLTGSQAVAVIDLFKTVAKQDLTDRRKRQQSDMLIERGEEKAKRIRVTSVGGQRGLQLSLLIDPEGQVRRTPENLGMLDTQFEELKALLADPTGIVLLAGQPRNGRTSTMYTIVKMHDAYTSNVQTVELDVQDSIEGARQNKWDSQSDGPDHATLLRSIIRRDPNVVAVAELVDQATAKEIVRADTSRVRVYVSMRTDSAMSAIQQWVKAVGDPDTASQGLSGVIAQKLYRKLCTNCRLGYPPAPEMLKRLGLPVDKVKQLFKKGGNVMVKDKQVPCPVCNGSGYLQQGAAWEIYRLTAEDRELIKAGDFNALKTELRKRPSPSLQNAAIRRVAEGQTSLEELTRISGGEQQPAKPATAAAAPAKPG